ncbi:hypothetical protein NpPPO83_00010669 [Neofusicoccum parvum]|uniref:Uncharacterized protein n=1 Tax=Neofusicoccum parvum TaxID=310453 RepID=A0ACB5SHS7_9PEZI|nr:hypothetical protein NpPPO83_00010669 [Neofusicoccum parvum]
MPSPRRTRVTDGGSPVRSSSARSMDLGEMSQMSLIPAALNIPRQRRQQQPAVAEDPGSDSEPDDNNNKENEGFQPAPRTTSGRPLSDRHPLELIPPNDPRYSMESLRGRSSLSREVSFDFANAPSAAAGPPSHNTTTAAPHVFSSAPGQRPVGSLLPAHQRGTTNNSSSNNNPSPYPPRASGPAPPRTAPPIQPGGSHPSAAQRAYNEFPFNERRPEQ